MLVTYYKFIDSETIKKQKIIDSAHEGIKIFGPTFLLNYELYPSTISGIKNE